MGPLKFLIGPCALVARSCVVRLVAGGMSVCGIGKMSAGYGNVVPHSASFSRSILSGDSGVTCEVMGSG